MPFQTDMEGVETNAMNAPIPAGKYNLRIVEAVEKTSKNGDPMAVVHYEVVDGTQAGRHVKFHYVVFFNDKKAPGAGMSKRYLEIIGQPFEGKIVVNPQAWIGSVVTAKVIHEKGQDGNDYARVKFVDKYVVDYTGEDAGPSAVVEENPFS